MSHGGGGHGDATEPNMTPLLDLILQILMFFMVTTKLAENQIEKEKDQKNKLKERIEEEQRKDFDLSEVAKELDDIPDKDAWQKVELKLPFAQSARLAVREALKDPIFVNLILVADDKRAPEHRIDMPFIVGPGGKKPPPMKQAEARVELIKQFANAKARLPEGEKVRNPIILRADRAADYREVFQLMQSCSDAGFRVIKLRASMNPGD